MSAAAAAAVKAAAALLNSEKGRKAVGWVLVAVFSPIILLIAFFCSLGSGAASHNLSVVELCCYGGAIPVNAPEEYRNYIENFIKNWEIERVAFMDIVIMMVALSEFHRFPSIPTRVTLNEYIELAKAYSTSKSGQFVNGVLNAIADNLKKEGVLTKE